VRKNIKSTDNVPDSQVSKDSVKAAGKRWRLGSHGGGRESAALNQ
jgi:hypothetical protein